MASCTVVHGQCKGRAKPHLDSVARNNFITDVLGEAVARLGMLIAAESESAASAWTRGRITASGWALSGQVSELGHYQDGALYMLARRPHLAVVLLPLLARLDLG